MKTIKEERVKLQTFRALRRVNTPQNLKKWQHLLSMSPWRREARAWSQMLARLREEEGALIYGKSISASCAPAGTKALRFVAAGASSQY